MHKAEYQGTGARQVEGKAVVELGEEILDLFQASPCLSGAWLETGWSCAGISAATR